VTYLDILRPFGELPGPEDQQKLDREAEDGQPGVRVMAAGIIYSHLDVGGEDGNEEGNDEPGGEPAGGDG